MLTPCPIPASCVSPGRGVARHALVSLALPHGEPVGGAVLHPASERPAGRGEGMKGRAMARQKDKDGDWCPCGAKIAYSPRNGWEHVTEPDGEQSTRPYFACRPGRHGETGSVARPVK